MILRHATPPADSYAGAARWTALITILLAGCVTSWQGASPASAGPTAKAAEESSADQYLEPFVDPATLDPTVPTPESIIGRPVGDGAVRYDPMVKYLHVLADASPLVTVTPYAESHEGRTLYYVTITSEANHARLTRIKAGNAKLADPRGITDPTEAERLVDSTPGIAWMAYAIHGDELSSTDAAVQLAYTLAAGTDAVTRRMREELVINIDPLMNPDGRERYLAQLQHLTGKISNTDYQAMQHWGLWSAGRGNHYLFDLNRDWLMLVHPETQGRTAAILEWNPHLVVDSHEMGSLDTYLFDPPREPLNVNLSPEVLEWRRRFSADQAKAFDAHGWSYYTREWYEEWYPGYANAWTSLLGAIGILYEQAGVNAAAIKQAAGQVLTYREAVHHQFVSSMANLESLRANRKAVITDFHHDRRRATSTLQGSDRDVFLLPPQSGQGSGPDPARYARFVDLLGRHGIESSRTAGPLRAENVIDVWGKKSAGMDFPAGTLVVRSAQPHRRLLRAVLDFDPHMSDAFLLEERKDLENHRGTRAYDVSAWNLPMAYGFDAYWAQSVSDFTPDQTPQPAAPSVPAPTPSYGYLLDGRSGDIHRAVVRLLDRDCKLRLATKPFAIAGKQYAPGAVLLRNHENRGDLPDVLRAALADLTIEIQPVDTALSESGPDLGGERFELLERPRVAIASQWPISSSSFGSTWHLLDSRLGLRVSPVNSQAVGYIDLRKYNVIVLPDTWSTGGLAAVLNEDVCKRLASWVQAGGTLIAMGGSAAFVAGKDRGLGSVRLKPDVLDKLDEYKEALVREKAARDVRVDPDLVWGLRKPTGEAPQTPTQPPPEGGAAPPGGGAPPPPPAGGKGEAGPPGPPKTDDLKRQDEWQRIFSPEGVFAAAILDPEHWLCAGLGERLPVMIAGSYAFMSAHPVATPARLMDADDVRLSGLFWPEARQRWANTAYATVERIGNGQIILFASDPFFRGYLEGTGRLFLNALVFGPGLGTSTAVPW